MNLNTYRYFNEVAETRSIRRAADRLHVAPSAISRQIAILEQSLGTLLLERTNTGIQLTSAGLVLERFTRHMFRDMERVQESIRNLKGLRLGEVKIWVIEGLILDFLPRTIADFNEQFPAIKFSVYSESSDRIAEALSRDEADIGIVYNPRGRPGIEIVAQYSEPVMCMVNPTHDFAGRESLSLAEICSQQIALPITSFGLRQLFDQAITRQKLNPDVLVSTNNLELTKAMAITGKTIAIAPAMAARKELSDGRLRAIPIQEGEFVDATSAVCVHRDRQLSYAANEFLKRLVKTFQAATKASTRLT
ncbi:LysR family transcriptional regulator [Rhizobium daejeonense]|uniref:HTH-type transcriptional regulator TtuA n=1 Tax=Rhizobium daejeonense TaxID=240521 RepID=A0A6M1RWX5_9HYPH|nr:LysR family transcriptional regulator [Rhizobium daejeonense]NGO66012.1 LysR family transcriptional regulator [Rhizobium daejeonense]